MNRIRIALFSDRASAESVRQHLALAGISAELYDEPLLGRLWFVSKAAAGARLEVPSNEVETGMRLLLECAASADIPGGAIRCPECGSLRVDYPQFTQKSLLTNVAMGLAAVLRLIERDYYCEDCHCTWAKENPKPTRERSHMAPDYFIEGLHERPKQ
jgi:hypothetical protein